MVWLAWPACLRVRPVKIYWIEAQAPRRVLALAKHLGFEAEFVEMDLIADFHLASMATDWKESEMPMEDLPNIVRWIEILMRIPAWADPWPIRRE